MSLRFIYGRAGTGKSQFGFDEIKERIDKENKIYIITPEQFSFTEEQKLLSGLEREAVINAEVLTFNRMAYRIMNENGLNKTNLSKSGKAMLIYNILSKSKNELTFLYKSDENIETIRTTIKEFKKHSITVDNLKNVIDNTENKYLKFKLNDLYVLYNKYQEAIKDKYIDEEDVLSILARKSRQNRYV